MPAHKRKTPNSHKGSPRRHPPTPPPSPKKMIDNDGKAFWVVMTVFFFSGLCGLIYEVVWSRLLTLVFGNTTYAISTVVGVFMFGLALGSYLCGKFLSKIKNLLKDLCSHRDRHRDIRRSVYSSSFRCPSGSYRTFSIYL